MAANTAPPKKPDYGPAFIDPESLAAMMFISQMMIVQEMILGIQILAANHRRRQQGRS